MSLSIRKSWTELGNPQQPGSHNVRDLGKILDITQDHLDAVSMLGGNPIVLLNYVETESIVARWEIAAITVA
jgi:hypothetical protein